MHPELENLPKVQRYVVRIAWFWGSGRWPQFSEENETHIFLHDESVTLQDELEKLLKGFIVEMARRRGFDCGRATHPLRPWISSVRVWPEEQQVARLSLDELGLREFQDHELEWTKTLIEEGRLYVDHNYNTELAPENREVANVDGG